MYFQIHSIAGIGAGILSFVAFLPYIVSTIRGKNRPNRATWIIWGVLGFILLGSYKAAGATDAIWLTFSNVIAFTVVVFLSFKYGEGAWAVFDIICLIAAAFGIFLWWYLSSPLPTLYISVLIDFIGALPTLKKSYLNPAGENRLSWILFWIANTINLFAIQEWNFAMAFYPIYMFLITGVLSLILIFSEK